MASTGPLPLATTGAADPTAADPTTASPDDSWEVPHASSEPCYVTLDELIEAHCDRSHTPATQRRRRHVRHCYETHRGVRIIDSYFGKHFTGGAILTSDGQIHTRYPPELVATLSPAFERAIWRCIALSRKGRVQLGGSRRAVFARPLFSVMVYMLGVLDAQTPLGGRADGVAGDLAHGNGQVRRPRGLRTRARRERANGRPQHGAGDTADAGREQPGERIERVELAIRTATAELDELENHLRVSALDQARQRYLWGMLLGIPALLVAVVATLAAETVMDVGVDRQLLIGMIAFGGFGAALSVMNRLTSAMHGNRANFTIDHESGRTLVVLAGAFRPIVGALFAVALFVLIESELVPIELTTGTDEMRWYAYWGLAFLAGFTERFAQDAVSTAKPLASRVLAADDQRPAVAEDLGAARRPHADQQTEPRS